MEDVATIEKQAMTIAAGRPRDVFFAKFGELPEKLEFILKKFFFKKKSIFGGGSSGQKKIFFHFSGVKNLAGWP